MYPFGSSDTLSSHYSKSSLCGLRTTVYLEVWSEQDVYHLMSTLPSFLAQISTPVESPTSVCSDFVVDMAFGAADSAVALPLLYFSWALSSSGDQ